MFIHGLKIRGIDPVGIHGLKINGIDPVGIHGLKIGRIYTVLFMGSG